MPPRLDADNALDLVGAHDMVVDCSDNFRTKFLINDAAVLAQRPAVFASVYQYEGQLQVYKPHADHACLRCLWPDATADGVVGNCAEAGVLGPVPGAFGALQALLTLKILLGMPGQLGGELLLLDFMISPARSSRHRAAPNAPRRGCALIRELEPGCRGHRDRAALARGSRARAVSSSSTCAPPRRWLRSPRGAPHIPMPHAARAIPATAAAGRADTCWSAPPASAASRPRASCASRGIAVRSLAGGLQGLEAADPCSFDSKLPDVGTTIFTVMSRRALEEGALNIGQGFPGLSHRSAPRRGAVEAVAEGHNQYAPMEGVMALREQIAAKLEASYGAASIRMSEITVTCGGTEALYDAIQAVVGPGDEAIIFDPAYDAYEPAVRLAGGRCVRIALAPPAFRFDWDGVRART